MEIIAIKILSGNNTAIAIEASTCHYMMMGWLDIQDGEIREQPPSPESAHVYIPGIWYKPDSKKWGIALTESNIFVPMTAVVSIAFKSED